MTFYQHKNNSDVYLIPKKIHIVEYIFWSNIWLRLTGRSRNGSHYGAVWKSALQLPDSQPPSRKLTRGSFKDDKSISAKWSSTVSTLCFVVQRKLGKTQKDLKSFQSLLFSDNKSIWSVDIWKQKTKDHNIQESSTRMIFRECIAIQSHVTEAIMKGYRTWFPITMELPTCFPVYTKMYCFE